MLVCDLCKKEFALLTPFNLKDMVWAQRETLQRISKNEDLKNFDIDLCYDCRKKVFDNCVLCIPFRQDLFEALKNKVIKKQECIR